MNAPGPIFNASPWWTVLPALNGDGCIVRKFRNDTHLGLLFQSRQSARLEGGQIDADSENHRCRTIELTEGVHTRCRYSQSTSLPTYVIRTSRQIAGTADVFRFGSTSPIISILRAGCVLTPVASGTGSVFPDHFAKRRRLGAVTIHQVNASADVGGQVFQLL